MFLSWSESCAGKDSDRRISTNNQLNSTHCLWSAIWVASKGQRVLHGPLIRCKSKKKKSHSPQIKAYTGNISHAARSPAIYFQGSSEGGIPYRLAIVGVDLNLKLIAYGSEERRGDCFTTSPSVTCPKHTTCE